MQPPELFYEQYRRQLSGDFTNYFRRTRDTGDLTQRGRKKTKVVATVDPASEEETVLRRLFHEGMNVARMNMGHGDYPDHQRRLDLVRHVSEDLERPVAVLVDLQGPKIRTGRLAGGEPVEWKEGDEVVITCEPCPEGTAKRVGTTYDNLYKDVTPGDTVLVDDGRLHLRAVRVEDKDIVLTVELGGRYEVQQGYQSYLAQGVCTCAV